MMDCGNGRLWLALAASALLHGWIASAEFSGARRANLASGMPLSVALPAPAVDVALPAEPSAPVTVIVASPQRATAETAQESPKRQIAKAPAVTPDTEPRGELAIRGNTTHTQPSDPTYYAARSLDVYPKALTVLDLGGLSGSTRVRATVFIDESGSVNDVRAVEAATADVEQAARELLLRTRFSPAAKDGRVVKAQVLVSLE